MSDYRKAYHAINDVFSDTSVSAEETAARLKALKQKCEEDLAALRDDGVDVRSVIPAEEPRR